MLAWETPSPLVGEGWMRGPWHLTQAESTLVTMRLASRLPLPHPEEGAEGVRLEGWAAPRNNAASQTIPMAFL